MPMNFLTIVVGGITVPARTKAIPLSQIKTSDQVLDYASGGTWASMNFSSQASAAYKPRWLDVAKMYANVYSAAKSEFMVSSYDLDTFISQLHSCDQAAHSLRVEEQGSTSKPLVPVNEGELPSASGPGLSTITSMQVAGIPVLGIAAAVVGVVLIKRAMKK